MKYEFAPEPVAGEVVVAQNPAAGAVIGPDTAVKLAPGCRVPELRQRTLAALRKSCANPPR